MTYEYPSYVAAAEFQFWPVIKFKMRYGYGRRRWLIDDVRRIVLLLPCNVGMDLLAMPGRVHPKWGGPT